MKNLCTYTGVAIAVAQSDNSTQKRTEQIRVLSPTTARVAARADAVQPVLTAKTPTHCGARRRAPTPPRLPPRSQHGNEQEHTKYNEEKEARHTLAHLHLWRQLGRCGGTDSIEEEREQAK